MLSALIRGDEGVNAVWVFLKSLEQAMQTLSSKEDNDVANLRDSLSGANDYTDKAVNKLYTYVDAMNGGVGGLIDSTSYDPSELPSDKSCTLIALGAGTFTNLQDVTGTAITVSQANSITVFFRAAHTTYWNYKTEVLTAPPMDSTPTSGNTDHVVSSNGIYEFVMLQGISGIDAVDVTGSSYLKDRIVYSLRKNVGTVEDPEYEIIAEFTIPIATAVKAGLMPAYLDGVFDINRYVGSDTPYASLSQVLTNAAEFIPTAVRRDGMSIKFRQVFGNSSRYVQYRLMSTSFSTTVTDWQGVDEEPTGGSHNLVESGGVAEALNDQGVYFARHLTFNGVGARVGAINKTVILKTGSYIRITGNITSLSQDGLAAVYFKTSDNEYIQKNIDVAGPFSFEYQATSDVRLVEYGVNTNYAEVSGECLFLVNLAPDFYKFKEYQMALNELVQTQFTAINSKIPEEASSSNKLADKVFVNSSIATATATFCGTYNVVTDLSLSYIATHSQIESALTTKMGALSIVADNNDYAFVQIPTADETPTEIARVEKYKYNGSTWAFEYELNNSGFTAVQWASINSDITRTKVDKLDALPTNADLIADFAEVDAKITALSSGVNDNSAKITALSSGVKVSLSVSPTVIYKGENQSITLTGTMSNGTPTSMKLFDGSTQLKTTAATPITHTISGLTLTDNSKSYRVEGVTLGMTLTATASVAARYPIYYGFGVTASAVKVEANKYAATTSANHTYEKTLAAGSANQSFYLLVPTDITAPAVGDFTMNKAPFVVTKNPSGDTVTGYNVYRSANQYAAGTTIKAAVG